MPLTKKSAVFGGIVLTAFLTILLVAANANQATNVSDAQARIIALSTVNGTVTEVGREEVDGRPAITVEVTENRLQTDVIIDASTGQVIEIQNDMVPSTDEGNNEVADNKDEEKDDDGQVQLESSAVISVEQAKTLALSTVNGTVTDVETEIEGGVNVISVEVTENQIETDVKIDVNTGKIVKIESDNNEQDGAEDQKDAVDENADSAGDNDNEEQTQADYAGENDNQEQLQLDSAGRISVEQAKTIALNTVEGAVTQVERETVDGRAGISVEVTKNNLETDIKIDAKTGEVLKIERDQIPKDESDDKTTP